MKINLPETYEDLEAMFSSKAIIEDNIQRCGLCNKRMAIDSLRMLLYENKSKTSKDVFGICNCVDDSIIDFIIEKNIDVRGFTLNQVKNIVKAFFDKSYYAWRKEAD